MHNARKSKKRGRCGASNQTRSKQYASTVRSQDESSNIDCWKEMICLV